MTYSIYRLKNTEENAIISFMCSSLLKKYKHWPPKPESYEKIWEEMTEVDRFLVGLLLDKEEYKREEVLKLMGVRSGNYSMYRDRLLKRGILEGRQAHISLALPFFADYVKEYC